MIFGDSLSAAYGIRDSEGWVSLLEQRVKKTFINWEVENVSISGETTTGGLTRIDYELQRVNPTIVVVELGGNDGLRGYPIDVVEENLKAIVEKCLSTGAKVLVAGMRLPPNYGHRYTDTFYEMYGRVAEALDTGYIPFLLDEIGDQPELMQEDGVHPKANAQPRILENIWPELSRLIQLSS